MNPTRECYMAALERAKELAVKAVESSDPAVDADAFHVICDALALLEDRITSYELDPWADYAGEPIPGPLNRYRVHITAVGDDGSRSSLGSVEVTAVDDIEARRKAMDELWDDRLDAASCSPSYHTELLGAET